MLRIYKAPDGTTWRYEEGEQPEGYAEVTPEPKAKARRAPANKSRRAETKAERE